MINYRTSRSLIQKCLSLTIKKVSWKVWPDLAKIHHFGIKIKSFKQFCRGLFSNWQNFESTLANFCAFGQIFLFQRAKYWTSDLVIWSHCTNRKRLQEELYFGISLFNDRLTVLYLPMMMTMSLSWWLWPTKAVVILIIGTYSIFCKYFVYPTATIQNGSAVLNHFICYLLIYPPPFNWRFCVYEEGQFYLLLFKLTASFWSVQTQ